MRQKSRSSCVRRPGAAQRMLQAAAKVAAERARQAEERAQREHELEARLACDEQLAKHWRLEHRPMYEASVRRRERFEVVRAGHAACCRVWSMQPPALQSDKPAAPCESAPSQDKVEAMQGQAKKRKKRSSRLPAELRHNAPCYARGCKRKHEDGML